MSVLFDGRGLLGTQSGVGRYATRLAELATRSSDFAFRVLTLRGDQASEDVDTIQLTGFCATPVMNPAQHLRLPYELRRVGADVYHYPSCDPPIGGRNLVATCLDLEPLRVPHLFPLKIVLYYRIFAWRLKQASAIVAISQQSAADAQQILGIRSSSIRVIPLGVDARFRPILDSAALEEVRARYRIPERFVLYVGNTMPHKNVPRIVRAFAEARRVYPDLSLVLVGRPDRYRRLTTATVTETATSQSVQFIDQVPESDLPLLYCASEGLVFPSLYEGFGLPVLEAMACGTPVVTSERGSLAEIAGDAAMLVDPEKVSEIAEALVAVLQAGPEVSRRRSAGLDRASEFSWTRMADKHLDLYREVVQ